MSRSRDRREEDKGNTAILYGMAAASGHDVPRSPKAAPSIHKQPTINQRPPRDGRVATSYVICVSEQNPDRLGFRGIPSGGRALGYYQLRTTVGVSNVYVVNFQLFQEATARFTPRTSHQARRCRLPKAHRTLRPFYAI
jgi:hypothetical protein